VELPRPLYTSCLSVMLLESDAPQSKPPRASQYPRRRDLREATEAYEAAALVEVTPLSIVDGQPPEVAARMIVERMATQTDVKRNQQLALLVEPLAVHASGARGADPRADAARDAARRARVSIHQASLGVSQAAGGADALADVGGDPAGRRAAVCGRAAAVWARGVTSGFREVY
jgi:hypothetical protein